MHVAVLVYVSTLAKRMRVNERGRDSPQESERFDFLFI